MMEKKNTERCKSYMSLGKIKYFIHIGQQSNVEIVSYE